MHSDTEKIESHTFARDVHTRASLLNRVRDWSDDASWNEFFITYSRLIYSLALKCGLDESGAEEVVQQTMIGVANKIRDFEYDRKKGSFKQWIGVQAKWKINDHFRRTRRNHAALMHGNPTETFTTTGQHVPDERNNPEVFVDRDWHEAVAAMALTRVKMQVKVKHFQIFDLCVLKQWSLRRVSQTLGVSVPQVYLIKSRISLLIKRHVKSIEAQMEQLPTNGSFQLKQNTESL